MANLAFPYSHKETRLNLESAIPSSTVVIRVPNPGTTIWSSRTSQKRPLPADIPPAEDEKSFRQRRLASAASVFHRRHHLSPRSFLWRVLEEGKVLSVQSVDLCKHNNEPESPLTLRIYFPNPIRHSCVALADCEEHDVLSIFALTESNHLYTLTLRPEFFRRRSSSEDNIGDWCKLYLSSAFSFKHAHRLVALQSEQLLVSLHDGGLLRLDRLPGEDGSIWKETFYNEGGWAQGLRNLIPFQGTSTTRYGKVNIDLSAVTSIASPSAIIGGYPYVFTVSLDHRLRIWNLGSGRIVYMRDLLNQERQPNEMAKYVIHPSQSQLVKVYDENRKTVLVVTYSPIEPGQFKFWSVVPGAQGSLEMEDLFPDDELEPPTPTSNVWTLTDFSVTTDKKDEDVLTLWVLWKNNITYRVQSVTFQASSPASTQNSWSSGWTAVAGETLSDTLLPTIAPSDPADCTEKWLEYIMLPGRFTTATIESAISIYEKSLGGPKSMSAHTSKNLVKRICTVVASTTCMDRNAQGQMEYEKFQVATDTQWRRFYRLIAELDKQRGEALSLVFDSEHQMVWVITADGISAIRSCSDMERLWHNPEDIMPGSTEEVARLVIGASALRDSFSDSLLQTSNAVLTAELFSDLSAITADSLREVWEKCSLQGQITDEEWNQLYVTLGGGLQGLGLDVYKSLLRTMTAPEDLDSRLERLPLAAFGKKAVIRGVQETVELHRSICFDQLVLLLFVEVEIDHESEQVNFAESSFIYKQLVTMLKRLELLNWLFKNQISIAIPRLDRSLNKKSEDMTTVTVLEGCVGHLLGLVPHSGESTASLLTEILTRVCEPDGEYELQPALIQCFLLKVDRPDLALDFSRFCNQDPFSTYVQGRVFLAAKELSISASYFNKAAYNLAYPDPKHRLDHHSSGLLDETEWNLLHNGLPKYYYHIMSLYEKAKLFSYVIDFARLALQFIPAGTKENSIMDLRTELHSRLFNAGIQTSRYDIAYSALILLTDHALQHSSIKTLIFRMCESSSTSELFRLPFLGLHTAVDEILSQKCQSIVEVNDGVPYHKILYAWRIKHNDFRGAAAISLERLQRLQQSSEGDKAFNQTPGTDALETPITREYLRLINALCCVDPKQAWVFSEPLPGKSSVGGNNTVAGGVRKVITLDEIRKAYQQELDRITAIENNRFAFTDGDEMDIM